jgi:hypothetical protein
MSRFLHVGRNLICATYGVLGPAAPLPIDSHLLGKSLTLTSPNVAAVNLKRHADKVLDFALAPPHDAESRQNRVRTRSRWLGLESR